MKKYTFYPSRNIFFQLYINQPNLHTTQDIYNFVADNNLKNVKNKQINTWSSPINNLHNQKLKDLFCKLLYTKVPDLRNKVIHKQSYRPSLQEVEQCEEETREIVFLLGHYLEIKKHIYNL